MAPTQNQAHKVPDFSNTLAVDYFELRFSIISAATFGGTSS
jgi:hypothetical protein